MSTFTTQDHIDAHARQAWALAELLVAYYGESDRNEMSDEVMACLLENVASHLKAIRALNDGSEVQP